MLVQPYNLDLPSGWDTAALRYLANVETGSGDTQDADPDGQYPFIVRSPSPMASAEFSYDTEAVLTAGDGNVGEIFHHIKGKFHAHQRVYVISGFKRVTPRYFYYFFSSHFRHMAKGGEARTTVDSVRRWMITDMPFAVPPIEVQNSISDYLDRETQKIAELVAEQRGLIETLRERRQAIIERSAGNGLVFTSEMKDSTLAWISEVPAHWEVANIRRFATMKTGHTPSRSNPAYWVDCSIPWVTLADVWQMRSGTKMYVGDTESKISQSGLANSAAELLPAGTVMLSRTASVGFVGIMAKMMATSQDYWNWVCGPSLNPEYLAWVLRGMCQEINAAMAGSTHKTIYQTTAAGFRIPVPPLVEQKRIARYINEQTARIDELISESEDLITLSQERRAALITAAVTGQIDVREAA